MRRRARLLSPMPYLRSGAIYKGLLGGRRGWLAVGGLLWGTKLLRRAAGKTEEVVANERLEPGQYLRIEALQPLSRGERRAAKRAG